jgi:hypothetical protein
LILCLLLPVWFDCLCRVANLNGLCCRSWLCFEFRLCVLNWNC